MSKVRDRVQLLRKETQVEVPEMEASKEIAPPSLEVMSGLENGSDATAALSPAIPEQVQSNASPSSRKRQIEGMPRELQDQLETVMQQDFSSVKLHPNSSLASKMGALAFARGNEVHFAPGQYQPHTPQGRQLIGHEFAHLVQQRKQEVKANTAVEGMPVNDDPALEAAADAMGARVAEMGAGQPGGLSPFALEGEGTDVAQMKVENLAATPLAAPTHQAEALLAQEAERQDGNTASANEAEKEAEADKTEDSPEASEEVAANEEKQAEGENPELDALIAEQDGQAVEDEVAEQAAATAEGDAAQLAPDPGAGAKGFDWGNLTYLLAPTLTLPGLAIEKLSAAASAKLEKTSAPDWLKTGAKTLGSVQGSINQAIHQYGGELIEGAVMGDFKEDPTVMNLIGQVLIGVVPYAGQAADLRDTIHAIGKMTDGGWKEGGNWLNLGLTLLAWVPLLGDIAKVCGKLGKLKSVKNLLTKLEPASKAISETWGKVTKYFAPKIDAFKQFLSKGWNDLKTAATKKFNAAKEKVMATVSKVKSGISSAWNWVKGKVSAGVDWVKGNASAAWDKAKSMVTKGAQKLKDSIAKATKTIQQKAAALPQKLLDKTKAIWEGVKSGVKTVKTKVKSSLNGIKAKFKRFVDRVRQKWDDWRGKGKDKGEESAQPKTDEPKTDTPEQSPSPKNQFKKAKDGSYSASKYRENLKILTGMNPPKTTHAHHVFPQKLTNLFKAKGIDVNDPKYLAWWDKAGHQAAHGAGKYNSEWKQFLTKNPSLEQILAKGKKIMNDYGVGIYF